LASNRFGADKKSIVLDFTKDSKVAKPSELASKPPLGEILEYKPTISIQVLSNPAKDHVDNGIIKLKCLSGNLIDK
jgi:hypothetical protein